MAQLTERSAWFVRFAKEIQIDVSDGIFAPPVSWPYEESQWGELEHAAAAHTQLPHSDELFYEAHLMVGDPGPVGSLLAAVGCKRLLAHVETLKDVESVQAMFDAWKQAGAQEVGIAVLIDTPLDRLSPFIKLCDSVQLMSIARIGAQGEAFDERALSRVEELHARYPSLMVAVDGGISEANIEALVRAGANRLCVGSAISRADNPEVAYARMHERAMRGCAPVHSEAVLSNS